MISYNIEQACNDDHCYAPKQDRPWNWIFSIVAKLMNLYENKIPKFGEPVDTELAQYVETGCERIIRSQASGLDQGHFESERYFGKKGPEIQKTRSVTLTPKKPLEDVGPELFDGFVL